MNIANVTSRFLMLTGLDNAQIYKWKPLIDDACAYVKSIVKKNNLTDNDTRRVEMLCALYAYKLFGMCSDENISSFAAGDVSITLPDGNAQKADRLWSEYAQKSQDLIFCENFLFGRVM